MVGWAPSVISDGRVGQPSCVVSNGEVGGSPSIVSDETVGRTPFVNSNGRVGDLRSVESIGMISAPEICIILKIRSPIGTNPTILNLMWMKPVPLKVSHNH